MFNINDAYIHSLQEAVSSNKFDYVDEVILQELKPEDIPILYNYKFALPLKNMVKCLNCGNIFEEDEIGEEEIAVKDYVDYWDYGSESPEQKTQTYLVDKIVCPKCNYGYNSDEDFSYVDADTEDLFGDKYKSFEEYLSSETYDALVELMENQKDDSLNESLILEEDNDDFAQLKEQTKSELLKYLKKNGLDVDNLIKTGVNIINMQAIIDKLLDDYTSPVISQYEQQFGIGLAWDYIIDNNDIIINIETF